MNQAFVIDKSGSMYQKDKMNWVKESFDVFINRIREKDFVSLAVFDEEAILIFPPTQMKNQGIRDRFRDAVHSIMPGGGSNMAAGLETGYEAVLSNFHEDYFNRVLILTDGVGTAEGIYEIAETYNKKGIDISVIGYGENCDLSIIRDLAMRGGGTSRFISGRESMEETFGSELPRMVVTAVRDVELELQLLVNLENVNTWAYEYKLEGEWDRYEREEGKDSLPCDLAADSIGNIYIVDENNRIQKFDSEGNFIIQWGKMGKKTTEDEGEGKFYHPQGVAVDSDGNVYVADTGSNRIQKFDGNGTFITQWGSWGRGKGKFIGPQGVAVDSVGNVYVADTKNNRIQRFDSKGNFLFQWGSGGAGDGQFNLPVGVATDVYRNVYVVDSGNHRVQIFESDGTFITRLGSRGNGDGQFNNPTGITVDSKGNIYVADTGNKRIQKFDINGTFLGRWGSFGEKDGHFDVLRGITVDSSGNVYAADASLHRIQKFDTNGTFLLKQPIRYFFPTINLGDYETILIQADIPKQIKEGSRTIAQLKVAYTDVDGERKEMSPIDLSVDFVPMKNPVEGISDATVLKAGTILHYAEALKGIGLEYHSGRFQNALDMTNNIKKELLNARQRLGFEGFDDELSILENYIYIIGGELNLREPDITKIIQDKELAPQSADRNVLDHLNNLFHEIALDLRYRTPGNIAVSGFTLPANPGAEILALLDKTAESVLFKLPQFTILEQDRIDAVLRE